MDDSGSEAPTSSADAGLDDPGARLQEAMRLLKEAEQEIRVGKEREAALEGELQHRVRNMLAVVRSIFSRTVDTRTSLDDVADHFRGRLDALARYQMGTLRLPHAELEIEDMVRDELLQVGADGDARIAISGPEIRLPGREAEALGLALHELTTNSIKFGVLSPGATGGQLRIEWNGAGGRMTFKWVESGMAILGAAPLRYGFGREFIEQSLPYQHDARTFFELSAGALMCIIEFPLPLPQVS